MNVSQQPPQQPPPPPQQSVPPHNAVSGTTVSLPSLSHHQNQRQKECSNCGSSSKWVILLHHVRLRGILRRLCTSCVLRLHPSLFCPTCFLFYDSSPPHPSKRLSCSNCSSLTHTSCCSATTINAPFLCPPCADLSFTFFDINKAKAKANANAKGGGNGCDGVAGDDVDDDDDNRLVIDKSLAVVLLCAAKIAASSMGKAVIVARGEAERKVREAAIARKRAREALEHMLSVEFKLKGKARKREEVMLNNNINHNNNNRHHNKTNAFASEISGSGVVGGGGEREKQYEKMGGLVHEFVDKNMDLIVEKDSGHQQQQQQQQQKNLDLGAVKLDEKDNDMKGGDLCDNVNVVVQHLPKTKFGSEEGFSSK